MTIDISMRVTRRGIVLGTATTALLAAAGPSVRAAGTPTPSATPSCPLSQATPDADGKATPSASMMVQATNSLTFEPKALSIPVGATVTWYNTSSMPHTVTCDPKKNPLNKTQPELIELPKGADPWASKLLQPGASFSHTFDSPGNYRYICVPHVLSGMSGEVRVGCGDATPVS